MRSSTAIPRRSWVEQIMGMPVSVLARGPSAHGEAADGAARRVFADLAEVDSLFSLYRSDSAVSRLNRGEMTLAQCPSQVRAAADACEWARSLTDGLFDARRPDGEWDPSGWVKGWSAQEAFRHLTDVADLDWCLNAGGDVVVASPSGTPFVVGIADPTDRAHLAERIAIVSGAVATSGTGERGGHIWDPRVGRTVKARWASISVRGPDLAVADILATAAFVAGAEWEQLVARLPGYGGLAFAADRTSVASEGWAG
ncbi:MAG: FAD:protein FMN transferase [Sporichthyaceae bacterium]